MVVHRSPKATAQVRFLVGPPKQKPPFRAVFVLFLRLFEEDAFAERRIELHEFDLAFGGLSILPRPNNMFGLGRFEPEQAVLRHAKNVTERTRLGNSRFFYARRSRRALLYLKIRFVIPDRHGYGTALHHALRDHE